MITKEAFDSRSGDTEEDQEGGCPRDDGACIASASSLHHDWPGIKPQLTSLFPACPASQGDDDDHDVIEDTEEADEFGADTTVSSCLSRIHDF